MKGDHMGTDSVHPRPQELSLSNWTWFKVLAHTVVASTRRSWAAWEKRAIVDEARRTTSSISSVARRHGITPSLLFRWRRERLQQEQSAERPPPPAPFSLFLLSPPSSPPP